MCQFFSQVKKEEEVFVNDRFFNELRFLLKQALSEKNNDNERIHAIYHHPVFIKAIEMKQRSGTYLEKLLIYCLNRENYCLSAFLLKYAGFLGKVKRRLIRIISQRIKCIFLRKTKCPK